MSNSRGSASLRTRTITSVATLPIPTPDRIDTVIDFAAAEQFKVRTAGNADAADADVLGKVAGLIADGTIEVPIAGVFALDDVKDAFRALEERHTRGKLVLRL